jgi:hypothetical protein
MPEGDDLAEAGSIRNINSRGGTMNCVNCAIAADAVLAGRPASALLGGPSRIDTIEKIFGAKFSTSCDIGTVVDALLQAGSGGRGIVFGSRSNGVGHVFNVINQNGAIPFLDGQTGSAALLSEYAEFRFLRTN